MGECSDGPLRAVGSDVRPRSSRARPAWWPLLKRLALLVVSVVVLFVLAPGLIAVFGSWRDLRDVEPWWFVAMVAAEAASFTLVALFTKLVLPSASRSGIFMANLGGHALSTVVPGGAATGGAVEYQMLVGAGADPTAVASAMAVQGVVLTAAVFVLPVFALPAMILGAGAPAGLADTAYVGFAVFIVIAAFGIAVMTWDGPVAAVASTVSTLAGVAHRRLDRDSLCARLRAERDAVRAQLGRQWAAAVVFSVGKWLLEYLALVLALRAVGAHVRPSLVLLAYTASAVLSMIPVTPGGVGFVEAGLAGTLALAGLPAALVAAGTLAYRLVTYWLPLPVGFAAWLLYRLRHHGRAAPGGGRRAGDDREVARDARAAERLVD